jgi:hypothetical protein
MISQSLNQGQLKQFALAGLGELEERLTGGAGLELHALLNLWTAPDSSGQRVPIASPLADDYAPVNVGQLEGGGHAVSRTTRRGWYPAAGSLQRDRSG